jgi:acetoin utilization protein AcuB
MTPNPITIPMDVGLLDAYYLMLTHDVRRLPVVDNSGVGDGELVGIITRSDILQILPVVPDEQEHSEAEQALADMPIEEAMTWDPVTVRPDHTIQMAAELMLEFQISGLPVVDAGEIVGIITESDIFRLIVESWSEPDTEAVG